MEQLWKAFAMPTFDALRDSVMDIVYMGFPMATILFQVHDMVITRPDISDLDKAFICEKLAEVSKLKLSI